MINSYGEVIISEQGVMITKFNFSETTFLSAQIEALEWAKKKINKSLKEAKSFVCDEQRR